MPFQSSIFGGTANRRYGSVSPGEGWVYAGKTVKAGAPKNGWQTTDLWKKAPAPAAPVQEAAPVQTVQPTVQQTVQQPTTLPTTARQEPQGPTMADMANQFAKDLAAMQESSRQALAQQASQFAAMQQAQEERMATLQQQMAASLAARDRPTVAGVKTATSSGGTDMQIARKGAKGTFSRAGMRILSLNV